AFDGFDGVGAVGDGSVVYLDCALLDQALGLLAVGGEAGIDEKVEDADFACLGGFIAEGASERDSRDVGGDAALLELGLEVGLGLVGGLLAVVEVDDLPGEALFGVYGADGTVF